MALAYFAAALLWRPGRRQRAQNALETARRILLVRIDNRVGEALLMTPLLTSLKRALPQAAVSVLTHTKVARVLEGHPDVERVIAFDRRGLFLGAWAPGVREIKAQQFDVVVNCANWEVPSITSAIISRLVAGSVPVVGPSMLPVRWLTDVPVTAREDTTSELRQRLHLLSPFKADVPAPLSFRTPRSSIAMEPMRFGVVNPGGRLGWRRVPSEVFVAAARSLAQAGIKPVITWGPGEEALAKAVASAVPEAQLAPPTNLDELASLMRLAELTVCNNTGPMHLAVAVGCPTFAFFLQMSVERWGHRYPPHRMLDVTSVAQSSAELCSFVTQNLNPFIAALPTRSHDP